MADFVDTGDLLRAIARTYENTMTLSKAISLRDRLVQILPNRIEPCLNQGCKCANLLFCDCVIASTFVYDISNLEQVLRDL